MKKTTGPQSVAIKEAYIPFGKAMLPIVHGILSVDTAGSIQAMRDAIKSDQSLNEEKPLENSRKDKISKTCKSK